MISRHPLLLAVSALTVGLTAGCLSLKPKPDPARHYLLSSDRDESKPAPVPRTDAVPIFLGRVEMPDYLQNLGIVTRLDETEIHISEVHLWAEPLSEGVTRVLRDALAAHCGPDRVHPAVFRRPAGRYLEVQVAVTRLDSTFQGAAIAAVRWNLLRQPGADRLSGGEWVESRNYHFDAEDYGGAVEALSRCVVELGQKLAEQCEEASLP